MLLSPEQGPGAERLPTPCRAQGAALVGRGLGPRAPLGPERLPGGLGLSCPASGVSASGGRFTARSGTRFYHPGPPSLVALALVCPEQPLGGGWVQGPPGTCGHRRRADSSLSTCVNAMPRPGRGRFTAASAGRASPASATRRGLLDSGLSPAGPSFLPGNESSVCSVRGTPSVVSVASLRSRGRSGSPVSGTTQLPHRQVEPRVVVAHSSG